MDYDYGGNQYLFIHPLSFTFISKTIELSDIYGFEDYLHNTINISYLTNIFINALANYDILVATDNRVFVNIPFGTMMIDAEQLRDFDAASPNDGQILIASNNVWTKKFCHNCYERLDY